MKIVFLAPANSIHTQRWVTAMCARNHDVTLISQHAPASQSDWANARLILLPFSGGAGYFLNSFSLRKLLSSLRPDILNAHYASGYGTMARLSGFRPILLSVWGSDVFDFPYESLLKRKLLDWNLLRATRIASTSNIMANQVRKLASNIQPIFVTPFGVDCGLFSPRSSRNSNLITIGTVKTLETKYGIDLLIRAVAGLLNDQTLQRNGLADKVQLVLVGGGSERIALEALANELGILNRVVFRGPVPHAEVPKILNQFDIYVAASRLDSESFGVAAVEASACGLPVVVSDAGGLPEVVLNCETGFVVPRENVPALISAIKSLVIDSKLRTVMGNSGRRFVLANYEWEKCVDKMESAYFETASVNST